MVHGGVMEEDGAGGGGSRQGEQRQTSEGNMDDEIMYRERELQ